MRIYDISKVIGNAQAIYFIRKAIMSGKFPKYSIMQGTSGTGKSTMAEISAMALKCPNTVEGQPCLKCKICKLNIQGMESYSGAGLNIKKIDLGSIHTYKDLEELKEEVFGLKSDYIYILEELQSLSEDFQNSLLESMKGTSDNKYIIFCTTEARKIIKAFKGRCTIFEFKSLSNKESIILMKEYCKDTNIPEPNKDILNSIYNKYKGVPREMLKELELIVSTEASNDMIRERLGDVATKEIEDLFRWGATDYVNYIIKLDSIQERYPLGALIRNIKEYVLSANMYVIGGCKTTLPLATRKNLDLTFNKQTLYKVSLKLEPVNEYNTTETDFRLIMSNIHAILKYTKNPADMHSNDKAKVSKQVNIANKNKEVLESSQRAIVNSEKSNLVNGSLASTIAQIRIKNEDNQPEYVEDKNIDNKEVINNNHNNLDKDLKDLDINNKKNSSSTNVF